MADEPLRGAEEPLAIGNFLSGNVISLAFAQESGQSLKKIGASCGSEATELGESGCHRHP
jgi:hypothetical protein